MYMKSLCARSLIWKRDMLVSMQLCLNNPSNKLLCISISIRHEANVNVLILTYNFINSNFFINMLNAL